MQKKNDEKGINDLKVDVENGTVKITGSTTDVEPNTLRFVIFKLSDPESDPIAVGGINNQNAMPFTALVMPLPSKSFVNNVMYRAIVFSHESQIAVGDTFTYTS